MSEPFIGEIRMFAGTFAPRGHALCDGQLLAISQNDALFSLFGTIYGGDGRTTFGLPDLRGRLPLHLGAAPGLSARPIGQKSGTEQVTLTTAQLPAHTHALPADTRAAADGSPGGAAPAQSTVAAYLSSPPPTSTKPLAAGSITNVGGSQPHDNMMPYQCITFIVALTGIYPSRS
ncbi:MAG: tail fiber protein [Akkermansiaceae bacterium]|nr:tail fiber protein [Akkermansiaceae bacterium]